MTRSRMREELFKLLFRVEFNDAKEMEEQVTLFFEDEEKMTDEEKDDVRIKYEKIHNKLDELDAMINDKTTGWNTERMGKAELSILRLAIFEINYDENVPTAAAINEAVELAKKYGADNASAFINGVLAKFA